MAQKRGGAMKISIVVPVYNEVDNISALIAELVTAMDYAQAYEIIYVDDGSQDDTAAVLKQALQNVKALRVIRHQQSCGQSTAIVTGVKAASYPYIATLDGDGQNDPADIPRLYQALIQQRKISPNLWMIAGWRHNRYDSAWRLFTSKVANAVRSGLLGDNTPDTGCGLKVFLKDEFLRLPYFDHMHRFLPALVIRAGGQVISEPVNHRVRAHGYSKYGTLDRLWVGMVDILGVIWLQRRAKLPEANEVERG
jgi:dolichol-phosphate mannosyltransferase